MTIGIIAEDKTDYDAIKVIINKISNKPLDTVGAYGSGKTSIIHDKKKFSDKLFNFNCDKVIIIRDSDGKNEEEIIKEIKSAYDDTRISSKYYTCLAVEELETWFLADLSCIRSLYNIPSNSKRMPTSTTDELHSPKEILKAYVEKWSKGKDTHLQSDGARLANLINIDVAMSNSISFRNFHKTITAVVN
jgi:hypothetical protein